MVPGNSAMASLCLLKLKQRVSSLIEWVDVNLYPFPVLCSAGLSGCCAQEEMCTKSRVLLAENRLGFLHTALSRCIKSVLE